MNKITAILPPGKEENCEFTSFASTCATNGEIEDRTASSEATCSASSRASQVPGRFRAKSTLPLPNSDEVGLAGEGPEDLVRVDDLARSSPDVGLAG
ncbi:hypothetical protein [Saccharopolyspora sp. 5N708]|uniref:hypothetical protein n=1 Tax=Saccharopolyspora sp. 5N708 TaxID=3457424 RepID=UPI003FD39FC6